MKINWKIGIIVLYTGFVAMILLLVGMSLTQKTDLVTENYYEEELQFQDKINKIRRTAALTSPLTWEVNERGVMISYPKNLDEKSISGTVKLYCPSNIKNDRSFAVSPSKYQQFIPTATIPKGNYHLQIDWKNGDQSHWNEDVILINH
jgi:nitrogen fixation protein FixH